jgi:hypothetical protein
MSLSNSVNLSEKLLSQEQYKSQRVEIILAGAECISRGLELLGMA